MKTTFPPFPLTDEFGLILRGMINTRAIQINDDSFGNTWYSGGINEWPFYYSHLYKDILK